MASIQRRKGPRGARYDVRWPPTPSQPERSKAFPALESSRAFKAQIEADLTRGVAFDPRAGRVTLQRHAEDWLEGRHLSALTREVYDDTLRRHVYPTFGDVALNRITPELVRRWHRPLADRIPSTAAKSYRILRAILATAVEDQLIARNPCASRGAG